MYVCWVKSIKRKRKGILYILELTDTLWESDTRAPCLIPVAADVLAFDSGPCVNLDKLLSQRALVLQQSTELCQVSKIKSIFRKVLKWHPQSILTIMSII